MKNLFGEEFLEGIEKAKRLIPEKPTIVVKNATVTGVKLNSKIINSIPKSEEPISFYEGINVYKDDSLDKPRFIVEGEIEKKNYLKWEDLKSSNSEERLNVKLNNIKYELHFEKWAKYDDATRISLYLNEFCVMSIRLKTDYDKQFFNDLHLEAVE